MGAVKEGEGGVGGGRCCFGSGGLSLASLHVCIVTRVCAGVFGASVFLVHFGLVDRTRRRIVCL